MLFLVFVLICCNAYADDVQLKKIDDTTVEETKITVQTVKIKTLLDKRTQINNDIAHLQANLKDIQDRVQLQIDVLTSKRSAVDKSIADYKNIGVE